MAHGRAVCGERHLVTAAILAALSALLVAGAIMAACATTTMGWFGLMFTQLLRIAPREELALCSGGLLVFTFSGSILGPSLVSWALERGASYAAVFTCLGVLTIAGGAALPFHAPSRAAERIWSR